MKVGDAGKVEGHDLSSLDTAEYVSKIQSRMEKGIMSAKEAVEAKDFLGDLDSQYRHVLTELDEYITIRNRLITKDGPETS